MHHIVANNDNDHKDFLARLLVKSGIDVDAKNRRGKTAPDYAAGRSQTGVVVLLLYQPELVVYATDKEGRKVLHIAAYQKQEGLVKHLLDHPGSDINTTDNRRETALHNVSFWPPTDPAILRKMLTFPDID